MLCKLATAKLQIYSAFKSSGLIIITIDTTTLTEINYSSVSMEN